MSISRKVFFGLLILCALTALPVQAESVTKLYDIDFSSPLHTVGQPPAVGAFVPTCKTVHESLLAVVTESFGELEDQPCLLHTDPNHWSSISHVDIYDRLIISRYSRFVIEMDVLVNSLFNQDDRLQINFGGHLSFFSNGRVTDGIHEADYDFDTKLHVTIYLDQTTKQYQASVEDNLFSGSIWELSYEFLSIRLADYDSASNKAAIDNVVVYGINDYPELTMTEPRVGDGFTVGKTYPITWYSSSDVQNVSIEYSTDSGATWSPITPQNTGNTGVYNWMIPNAPSNFCRLRMTDSATGVQAENGPFRICAPVAPLPPYDIVDLHDIFGDYFSHWGAVGNDHGDLVCETSMWVDGQLYPVSKNFRAVCINNNKQVLIQGYYNNSTHFQIWQDGRITDNIQMNNVTGIVGWATDLNDSGHVIGYRNGYNAFIWNREDGIRDIGEVQGYSHFMPAYISNSDKVFGECRIKNADGKRIFSWENDTYDVLPVSYNFIVGANNTGTLAFNFYSNYITHTGFLMGSQLVDMGEYRCDAINDAGMLVGTKSSFSSWQEQYEIVSGAERFNLLELADLPVYTELSIHWINNNGWITAQKSFGGYSHTVLLLPRKTRFLREVTIVGPDIVFENTLVSLRAVGVCEDNCPVGLTEQVTWNVYPAQAGFVDPNGFLHAGDLDGIDEIVVTAEYEGDQTLRTYRVFPAHAARQIYVPSDYPTIQAALDAAEDTDEIILEDGWYEGEGNRDILIPNKQITLKSLNGPANCVIDANSTPQDTHWGIAFQWSDVPIRIEGISIVHGNPGVDAGNAAYSTAFVNCRAFDNMGDGVKWLKGIWTDCTISGNRGFGVNGGSGNLFNCTVSGNIKGGFLRFRGNVANSAIYYNRAAGFDDCDSALMQNCIVSDNNTGFYGCSAKIVNCTIIGNTYGIRGGYNAFLSNCILYDNNNAVYCIWSEFPTMNNCLFYENNLDLYQQRELPSDNTQVEYRRFHGADEINALPEASGTISDDPLFIEVSQNWYDSNFRLRPGSPCIDAGIHVDHWLASNVDPDGVSFPQDGNLDGTAQTDIGAYEYVQSLKPVLIVSKNEITLGGTIETETAQTHVTLSNWGMQDMAWSTQTEPDWLQITPSSAIIGGLSSAELTISTDLSALEPGTYTGNVVFVSQNSLETKTLTVTLVVGRVLHVPSEYSTIQAAVDAAQNYDTILLADGIYTGNGNRDVLVHNLAQFHIKSENGSEACILDIGGSLAEWHYGIEFVLCENIRIQGLTFKNGYMPSHVASAIDIWSQPTGSTCIENCVFENNYAALGQEDGRIVCSNSQFCCNELVFWLTHSEFNHCVFERNSGTYSIGEAGEYISFHHCRFSANYLNVDPEYPGGTLIWACNGDIRNCIFEGNRSPEFILCFYESQQDAIVSNCTFWKNEAGKGSLAYYNCNGLVRNTVAAGVGNFISTDCFEESNESHVRIEHSNLLGSVGGNWSGIGNISADPLFVREGYWDDGGTPGEAGDDVWVEGDYHLQSEGWSWDVQSGQWMWNEATSPCIDAGHPAMALGDEPLTLAVDLLNRFGTNIRVNMGAYGGTAEASMAPEGWALRSDLDNSGRVTADDLAMVATMWLDAQALLPADTTRDGIVDAADLALMAEEWLKTALRLED